MRDSREAKQKPERPIPSRTVGATRRLLSLIIILLFTLCALLTVFMNRRASASTDETLNSPRVAPVEAVFFKPAQDYSRFSHSSPGAHAALSGRNSCNICHERRDNSATPRFPGHKACISCHQTQFTTPSSGICTICHTSEGLSQQNPPLKGFPGNLSGFTADFDHAQHMTGVGKPQDGCAACHAPARRGIARAIPAGLNAHQTCYTCHTPGRQSGSGDISSCGSCHGPGRYAPTSANGRSFGLGFSHADHGPRQNLSCESCHTVARRGTPQGRQVSSTFPAQHFPATRAQNCATCHNNQRSFGEANFIDCKRCHTGSTFRL
jgi:hypothetical protein